MKKNSPATKILNKAYARHLIKLAQGQSYASNPNGGTTPKLSPSSSSVNAPSFGSSLLQGAKNVGGGLYNFGRGMANFAGGALATPLAYAGGLDANGPWKHDFSAGHNALNHAGAGARDMVGGIGQIFGGAAPTNVTQAHKAQHEQFFSNAQDKDLQYATNLVQGTADAAGGMVPGVLAGSQAVTAVSRIPQIANATSSLSRVPASIRNAVGIATGIPTSNSALAGGATFVSQLAQQSAQAAGAPGAEFLPANLVDNSLRTVDPNLPETLDAVAGMPASPVVSSVVAGTEQAKEKVLNIDDHYRNPEQFQTPEALADSLLPNTAPPEHREAVVSATNDLRNNVPADQIPNVAKAMDDPNSPEGQQLTQQGFENYKNEQAKTAPQDPASWGGWLNNLVTDFQKMDTGSQIAMGLGLGSGVIGLLGGLMGGGGIGSFLMAALGLGAAGLVGANSGLFGEGASNLVGDMAYNIGKTTGMIPEDGVDLSMLKGDDFMERLTGGPIGTREEVAAKLKGVQEQAAQLNKFMSLPLGDNAKVRMMQRLDPTIESVEDGMQRLENAKLLQAQLNNPESALNQKIQRGQDYANSTGLSGWLQEQGAGWSDWWNNSDKPASANTELNMNIVDKIIAIHAMKKAARCWEGYEPVPGKKPYSEDSCRPKGSKKTNKKEKKPAKK